LAVVLILGSALHPARAEPITIVTLGDSITKGVRPGVKADETFAAVLQALLKKDGLDANVQNVGIGSEDTDLALKRFGRDVLAKKPRLVTIMYAANDHWIHKPRGKTEPTVPPAKFEANLRKMAAELHAAGAVVVFMTTPPPIGPGSYPKGEEALDRLEAYNRITRTVAADTRALLVDHYADWKKKQADGIDLRAWITDAWHPNPRGHAAMAERMFPVVRDALRASP
jgi:lysophospholipase L1-like esterase